MSPKSEDTSRPTIQEVARLARVSIASVSRALNNKTGISQSTRKHILRICAELNYPSNSGLEGVVAKQHTVALSLGSQDTFTSRYTTMIWPYLATSLYEQGKQLVPVTQQNHSLLPTFDSAILLGVEHDDHRVKALKENNIPFVCIGTVEDEFWTAPDDFNGVRSAMEYLSARGRSKTGFVTPTRRGRAYQARYQGYVSAMASLGLPIRELKTENIPQVELAVYRHFFQLSESELAHFDSFMCECDEAAIGLIAALRDRGFRIPEDYSVIGFDGFPDIYPELTTVVQDVQKIAFKTIELLDSAIAGEMPKATVLPVTLRIGQTT